MNPRKRKGMLGSYDTYKQWLEKDCQSMTWLDCETAIDSGFRVVTKLKCKVCTKFREKIAARRNFNEKWLVGAESIRTSSIREHCKSDQHVHAMNLEKKAQANHQGLSACSYAPIAQSMHTLADDELAKLKMKFDVAYFVASEQLSLEKYPKICELQRKHGVNLGTSYLNRNAGKGFIHYIADSNRKAISSTIAEAPFFSLLFDSSTDKSNIDNELTLVLWCDLNGEDKKVHTRVSFLSIE